MCAPTHDGHLQIVRNTLLEFGNILAEKLIELFSNPVKFAKDIFSIFDCKGMRCAGSRSWP